MGPPPDGACPVCGELLAGVEPSIPEALATSTDVGVVPTVAEEPDATLTSAPAPEPAPGIEEPSQPSEPSIVEDTVVSGMQLLPPEAAPEGSETGWESADVAGEAAAAIATTMPPSDTLRVNVSPVAAPAGARPGLADFLALVRNGSHGARERECPSCHQKTVASADELCPHCGDLLDGTSTSPAAAPVTNGHGNGSSPVPVATIVRAATATAKPGVAKASARPSPSAGRPAAATPIAAKFRASVPPAAAPRAPEKIVSRAQERECPHCHASVVAAPDELCPICGDFLDAPPKAAAEAPATGSLAALRECPHCKKHVFAAPDELCPECGDLLEGAPLVEDSMPPGVIEERDCRNCGARVVGTPGSPCPACGRLLGALLRPASSSPAPATEDATFDKTVIGAGAAAPLEETQVCSFCTAEIPREAETCPACGESLLAVAAESAPDDEATVAERAAGGEIPAAAAAAVQGDDANENTVADAPAAGGDAELVLGETEGTEAREERFPSPKVPRSREQVSLPGRKKPAAVAKLAAPAAAAKGPATEATPAPPWQPAGGAVDPVKLAPVRAVAAGPGIGTARGAAAVPAPVPAPRRSGLLIGVVVLVGLAGIAGTALAFFGGALQGTKGAETPTPITSVVSTQATTGTSGPVVTAVPMGAIVTPTPHVPIVVTPPPTSEEEAGVGVGVEEEETPTPAPTVVAATDKTALLRSACAKVQAIDSVDEGVLELKKLTGAFPEAQYCLYLGYKAQGESALACGAVADYLRVAPTGPYAKRFTIEDQICRGLR